MKKLKLLIAKIFGIDKMIYLDILEEFSSSLFIRQTWGYTNSKQALEFDHWYDNILARYCGHFHNKETKSKPIFSKKQSKQMSHWVEAWHQCGGHHGWELKKGFMWQWHDDDIHKITHHNYEELQQFHPKPSFKIKEANNGQI